MAVQVAGPFKVESKSCDLKTLAEITRRKELLRALMIWVPILTVIICLVALTLLARKRWPVVPSHVIVRQKDVCCANCVTAAGIATGLAVMLISFGPGIYFLYAERIESKKTTRH